MLEIKSIRKRVIVSFIGYAVVFLSAISVCFYFFLVSPMYERTEEQVLNKASKVADQVSNNLESLLPTLQSMSDFSQQYQSYELLLSLVKVLFSSRNDSDFIISGGIWPEPFTLNNNEYKSSIFYNFEGGEYSIVNDYNKNSKNDYFYEPWYQSVMGKPSNFIHWSEPYIDPYTKVKMVTLSKPYYVRNKFSGVVTLDISLIKLADILEKEQVNFGGDLFILDLNGHDLFNKSLPVLNESIATTVTPSLSGWRILAGYPKDKVYSQVISNIELAYFIIIPVTLFFLFFWYKAVFYWLINPIEKITQELTSSSSDMVMKVTERYYSDELNVMVNEINKRIHKISKEKQNAIRADKVKSTFLASMSHEIRTPMNGVLGLSQLLMKTPLNREQEQYLSTLYESGIHMMSILNDILDFSKIEEGKLKIDNYNFSFNDITGSLQSTYEPLAKEKGIELMIYSSIPNDLWLLGDKSRIRQILFNLVSNAIKFTAQGEVSISFDAQYPCDTYHSNGFRLLCTVKDTGVGIPESSMSTIFDPFIQAESSTSRTYGGTGLGLAIVRQLVDLMNGQIKIKSTLHKGTDVSFDIYMLIGKNQKPIRNNSIESNIDKLRVLIVEDNKVNTIILKTFLTKKGHEVICVENGQQCLDTLESEAFDVIFMDNHMPVMDGISATIAIKKHTNSRIAGTLVFACTADAYKETKDAMLRAGCNFVLTKPLNEPAIFDALNQFSSELQLSKMQRIVQRAL
ncbi:ATP-binding protein [Plesiomonas sp.]|uniref:hybrid sensor histidine kinase/response regulator n=1 Tax=Plesiomonas sp. TaxID=2486279 RepID=UPI003F35CBAB